MGVFYLNAIRNGIYASGVAILISQGFSPISVIGQSANSEELLATNSPFVVYLQNAPWIKDMVYVESQFHRAVSGDKPGKSDRTTWINATNHAAIQPSGLFIERLTGSPFGPKRTPDQRLVHGISDHYDWNAEIDENRIGRLSLSSKLPSEGASEKNLSTRNSKLVEKLVNRIRHFGLPPLRTNSFRLLDQNQFEAVTDEGFVLSAKIQASSNNNPLALTYILEEITNDVFSITYGYPHGGTLPTYFEYREMRNGRPYGIPTTNRILTVSYGIDESVAKGYSPSAFFTNLAIFTRILIESNGQRFLIKENGQASLIDESPPPPLPGKEKKGKAFTIIIIFLIAGGLVVWRVHQRNL